MFMINSGGSRLMGRFAAGFRRFGACCGAVFGLRRLPGFVRIYPALSELSPPGHPPAGRPGRTTF